MPEAWIEQHVGLEAIIRPEFRNNLACDLHAEWREQETLTVRSESSRPARHLWRVGAWLTAVAAMIVGLVVLLDQPASKTPPIYSVPSTISSPSVPATTSPDTTLANSETDVLVPLAGGKVIQPTAIATVPMGGGPGQLTGYNGEFPPLVAAFPDSLLVLDEIPFSGLTGRALSFDRRGQWDRDLSIDGVADTTPLWVGAAPNGVLFVATGINSDPSRAESIQVTAHRLVDDTFIVVDIATLADLSETPFFITPDGLSVRDRQIIAIPTGAAERPPAITLIESRQNVTRVAIARRDTGMRWVVEVETEADSSLDSIGGAVGAYNGGAWYSAHGSSNPMVSGPFLALLDNDSTSWYRLAAWSLATSDDAQIVFTRATTGGLELAVLGSPPPDLSEDLLATWPTPPAPDVSLSDAPMMLPSIAMPDGATRIQGVGESSGLVDYNQYWIDGATGIVLSIQTDILQGPGVDGTFVTVAPWDNAFFSRMSGGYEQLILVDPAGSVALWTNGLDRSQLVDIARSLRPRATSGGWESDGLPAGMVAVNEGWTVGGADRTVLWANAELSISSGGPSAIVTPLQFGSTARLTDVNGAPAMFFDHGDWSALGWSPEPGITVVFALYGTPAEVEAAARTIGRVDVAAWEGESTDVTGQDDGCQSSFFC